MSGTAAQIAREILSPTPEQRPGSLFEELLHEIGQMPLDDPPELEGDDSILAGLHGHGERMVLPPETPDDPRLLVAAAPPKALHVPLYRPLRRGDRGNDVLALQRALKRLGIRRGRPTGLFGVGTVSDVKHLQKKAHLEQTGNYGLRAHAELLKLHAYDSYGAWLMARSPAAPKPKPSVTKGQVIVATAMLTYHHREEIGYTQGSMRMMGVTERIRPPRVPPWADCSALVTWDFWVAGVPDPNGLGYNGFGYTGTLALHGFVVRALELADLVLYPGHGASGYPWAHVAVGVGAGRVVSHGSQGGPYLLPYDYRRVGQIRRYPMK